MIQTKSPASQDSHTIINLSSHAAVNPTTLESKDLPHVYFAGEVLDIDGITGGFNFQAAWTTAYPVAQAISQQHH